MSKTNPPPVGNQKTSRVRNLKTQWSGNAEVGRTFGDMVHFWNMMEVVDMDADVIWLITIP